MVATAADRAYPAIGPAGAAMWAMATLAPPVLRHDGSRMAASPGGTDVTEDDAALRHQLDRTARRGRGAHAVRRGGRRLPG